MINIRQSTSKGSASAWVARSIDDRRELWRFVLRLLRYRVVQSMYKLAGGMLVHSVKAKANGKMKRMAVFVFGMDFRIAEERKYTPFAGS